MSSPRLGAAPSRRLDALLVAVLCAIVFAQAWTSLRQKSMTYDELAYIPIGLSYVTTGDFRLNPEHPPLTKLLAGAALLAGTAPQIDTTHASWTGGEQWEFARHVFAGVGERTRALVDRARLPTVALTMWLVVGAWLLGSTLYGRWAGLLAAWLCAFSPNLLAHGRLATNDLAQACFVLWTSYACLLALRSPRAVTIVAAAVALALALLTKYSAILLFALLPLWALGAALWPNDRTRMPGWGWLARWSGRAVAQRVVALGAVTGAVVVLALLLVPLGYFAPGRVDIWVRNLGVLYTNVHADLPTYFAGRFHEGGLAYYFVVAFLLKTPLAGLALITVRAVDQIQRRDADLAGALHLLAPAALWLLAMTVTALQFGVRYILPVYPLLFVYAAGVLASPRFVAPWRRGAIAGLGIAFAASSLWAHPHYLPYFNALAGGPERGIHWLDDSNVDWGQDLPALATWLEARGIEDAVLVPMAAYDPALYGVPGRWATPQEVLPLLERPDPPPGVYAVSGHLLTRARWGGRTPAVDPLTEREPAAVLGHTLRIFVVPERTAAEHVSSGPVAAVRSARAIRGTAERWSAAAVPGGDR